MRTSEGGRCKDYLFIIDHLYYVELKNKYIQMLGKLNLQPDSSSWIEVSELQSNVINSNLFGTIKCFVRDIGSSSH